jgi:hypothetical protein
MSLTPSTGITAVYIYIADLHVNFIPSISRVLQFSFKFKKAKQKSNRLEICRFISVTVGKFVGKCQFQEESPGIILFPLPTPIIPMITIYCYCISCGFQRRVQSSALYKSLQLSYKLLIINLFKTFDKQITIK